MSQSGSLAASLIPALPVTVPQGGTGVTSITAHALIVGDGANPIVVLAAASDGQIPIGSTGLDPVIGNITSTGATLTVTNGAGTINIETSGEIPTQFDADTGTAIASGGLLKMAGGNNMKMAAAGDTVTVNMDTALVGTVSHDFAAGGGIGTDTGAGDTLLFRAYDVDGASYTTFATLTANNTPTMDLADTVTKASSYIYRGGGTDVPVDDGGTGTSSLTDHGVLVGSGTAAVTVLSVGATGALLVGTVGSDPAFATSAIGDFTFTSSTADETRLLTVINTDNTGAATSAARIDVTVGGGNVADPQIKYLVTGAGTFSSGIDNSDSDKFKISASSALGTTDVFVCTSAGEITKPLQSAFGAKAAVQSDVTGDGTTYIVTFSDTEYFDQNNDFDGVSIFTAPVAGKYQFNCELYLTGVGAGHTSGSMSISTTGSNYAGDPKNPAAVRDGDKVGFSMSMFVNMDASDVARIKLFVGGGTKTVDVLDLSYFNGYLVC